MFARLRAALLSFGNDRSIPEGRPSPPDSQGGAQTPSKALGAVPEPDAGPLGDHEGGRVGIAGGHFGHDGGVDHIQPFQAAHAQLRIDHAAYIGAHAAGAHGW